MGIEHRHGRCLFELPVLGSAQNHCGGLASSIVGLRDNYIPIVFCIQIIYRGKTELMDPAWIALISTFLGGIGLRIAERVLARGQVRQDAATALREELRRESSALKEEVRLVEKELDLWKEKYFTLLQKYLELKAQLGNDPDNDW